ncbi:MAG: 3'-5' exoribonuclease YhaM family protein [Pirellulales bacterium]
MNHSSAEAPSVVTLNSLKHSETADFFVQLLSKELLTKRDGQPFYRVIFRDARREVNVLVWENSPWHEACINQWQPDSYYKVRGTLQKTAFGLQLVVQRIWEVNEQDQEEGFDPLDCQPRSSQDVEALFNDVLEFVHLEIQHPEIQKLIYAIFEHYHDPLILLPAAVKHHHCYAGGFLEHITTTLGAAISLCNSYEATYPELGESETRDLIIAGCLLHDIGKIQELDLTAGAARYSLAGELIGHVQLGRDIVRNFCQELEIKPNLQLRLEHILASHPADLASGAARLPMTIEAMIVQAVDKFDSTLFRVHQVLSELDQDEQLTSAKNSFQRKIYRTSQVNAELATDSPNS